MHLTVCDECLGGGLIEVEENDNPYYIPYYVTCPKCMGDGELDWIENIVGKKPCNVKKKDTYYDL